MKNLITALLLGSVLCAMAPDASAHDRGKGNARSSVRSSGYRGSNHGYSSHGYSSNRGSHGYASSRVWVPGYYETITSRVWIPACTQRVWVEPVFELRIGSCGTSFRVQVGGGHWTTVRESGRYENRSEQVYRPGRWVARGAHH